MANRTLPKGIDQPRLGQYRARMVYDGARVTIGVYATQADAEDALTLARADKVRGTFVSPQVHRAAMKAVRDREERAVEAAAYTVAELFRDWLAFLERAGRAQSTIYTYESRYRVHIAPTFANRPIAEVTPADVEEWFDALHADRGNGVARPVYMTLSSAFAYACGTAKGQRRGTARLEESPCQIPEASTHKPVRNVARKVITPAEVAEITEQMPDTEQLAVLLAAWCGLRIGEVLALRRSDVTTTTVKGQSHTWVSVTRQLQARGGGLREVPPKSDAGIRTLPVPAALIPVLNAHLLQHAAKGAHGLLFHRGGTGEYLHPNVLRMHFNAARDRVVAARHEANEPAPEDVSFHALRHTALTHAGHSGATLKELETFGGHSDPRVVQRYQHAEANRLAQLADTMSAAIVLPDVKADVVPLRRKG